MKGASYPIVVKKGSVSVTIYGVTNKARGEVFEVTWFRQGERKRRSFRDEVEARKFAETTARLLDSDRADVTSMSTTDFESYRQAKQLLAKLESPVSLHRAIEEYVSIKSLFKGQPLLSVMEKYAADLTEEQVELIPIPDLVEEFIAAKTADGLSNRYIQDCRSRLGRFARDFKTTVDHLRTADMDAWLRRLGQSPRSRNNYRVLVVTLFRFARAAGYLPRDRSTEADHLARAKDRGNPIEIYSPAEMEKLLAVGDDHTIPFLALGGFAGLRSAEIERLQWEDLKWSQNLIEIKAGMAKTGQRRLVPMSANLKKWLIKWKAAKGPVIGPIKLFMRLQWLAKAAEVEWKRNALRHSYASYRLAAINDAGRLALEMGNSPNMIFQHYRELVTPKEARKWFAMVPRTQKN